MSLHVGTGAGAVEAREIHVGVGAGAAAPVLEGWIGVGGGARARFYLRGPGLSASASPDQIYWQVITTFSQYVSSSDASVAVSGGTAPYSFAWATSSGAATVNDSTGQSTGFQSTDGLPAEAWCVVTDAQGESVETNHVSLL